MASTRTGAKAGCRMASTNPHVAPMPTPSTAKATVQMTLQASIERRSGRSTPRAQARHLGPGVEGGDRDVGGGEARERGEQKDQARIAVGDRAARPQPP